MKRSTDRILTTHVGSLPEPDDISTAGADPATLDRLVKEVMNRQRSIGLDGINEGEYTKGGDWLDFMDDRFGGVEQRPDEGPPLIMQGKDWETFSDYYAYALKQGSLFYRPATKPPRKKLNWACTGPLTYTGEESLRREIALLKKHAKEGEELFLTTTAPGSLEPYRTNEYYASEEELLFAMAAALKIEYETIVKAGVILQVDDAWMPALWDRIGIGMGIDAFRRRCQIRCEALNAALADIPEDRIRYHLCWGSWHGPHAFDLELRQIVDIMLGVKAQAYLIEGANARHEHEYIVWEDVKLPEGKILIPGVVSHATNGIEHPQLVAQRILRFAERVGKENVIAGTDCGFGWRSHPQIAWAKLKSLREGADLASKSLGF